MIRINMEISLISNLTVANKHPSSPTPNNKTTEEPTPTKATPIIQANSKEI